MSFHWILQDNLYDEEGYLEVINTLNKFDVSYEIVHIAYDKTYPDINPTGPVMAYGSYSLARIAKLNDWKPGVFLNENHTVEKWIEHYKENMLNHDANILRLKDVVNYIQKPFFLRPLEDSKAFSGITFSDMADFLDWKDYKVRTNRILTEDTFVVMSSLKKIYKETRLFIVKDQVISGSVYKQAGIMMQSPVLDTDALDFAQSMIKIWTPSEAFVLDVALTDEGYKIVEINCINCSGLYASDIQKIIMTLDETNFTF